MNINLNKSGVSLLNALSNHSELIMQAYFSGSVNEAEYSPNIIQSLIDLKVLWRPESDVQLRLRPSLRTLLEESLQDESNRQIDANIGNLLATLTTQAEHYKEALAHQKYHESQAHLSDLTEHVYTLTETLSTNVRLLWSRISNEFGYVSSVDAKIRENELAQTQVTDMLNQLSMFHFDALSQLAGSHRELRHLLVITLQSAFATSTQELSLVQSKLLELLGRFREFKGRTRLLKGFMLHMEQKPDFTPVNYSTLSQVPSLFNRADGIIKVAAPDIHNVEHEFELTSLVNSLRTVNRLWQGKLNREVANPLILEQETSVSLEEDLLKNAVENYFCEVIDSGQNTRALDYYNNHNLTFDQEVWIYQVLGAFQGLPDSERQYFDIDLEGVPHQVFDGNFIIQDIELGLR
ncbi:phosphoenolpyruvate carboxylase [Psychrosphaera aquimarina]|uniref:Phosphoenolpyruvate carboxylase n=1 Tax=Psychrosphaera aquimarina TaxID=2044854 RepID=A0ABU3R584_9GAMM|nr:phosphoenolpyruvate carboxylase [Psychrosphaera aquimarina]MDU0114841.1 phosphoenolpyruvate carboxylase [Psychrosphaera aquimarina]